MTKTIRNMTWLAAVGALLIAAVFELPAQSVSRNATVWRGEMIEFEKADGADPRRAENQDRITDSVWITRNNQGGQIFNIAERRFAVSAVSPVGTRWARGTTDDLSSLRFTNFREAVGRPRDIVGMSLVMHIVEEDIYLDVEFTSWSRSKRGGFAYRRSTPD